MTMKTSKLYKVQLPYLAIMWAVEKIFDKCPRNIREGILKVLSFLAAIYFPIRYSFRKVKILQNNTARSYVLMLCLAIVILCCSAKKGKKCRWNLWFVIPLFFFAVVIIIAYCFHPIGKGFFQLGITILILLPLLSLELMSSDYFEKMVDFISSAFLIVGILFGIICIICQPYVKGYFRLGYTGITVNPNFLGMVFLGTMIAASYSFFRMKSLVLTAIGYGISIGMIMLSRSRTAIMAALILMFITIVRYIRVYMSSTACSMHILRRLMISFGCFLFVYYGMAFFTEQTGYHGIEVVRNNTDSYFKYTELEIKELNDSTAMVETVYEKPSEDKLLFLATQTMLVNHDMNAGFTLKLPNFYRVNEFSSGRIGVYKFVLDNVNLLGHNMERDFFVSLGGEKLSGAHNTPLDFTFRCGWPAGILCLLIEFFSVSFALKLLCGKKEVQPVAEFASMIFVVFFI